MNEITTKDLPPFVIYMAELWVTEKQQVVIRYAAEINSWALAIPNGPCPYVGLFPQEVAALEKRHNVTIDETPF